MELDFENSVEVFTDEGNIKRFTHTIRKNGEYFSIKPRDDHFVLLDCHAHIVHPLTVMEVFFLTCTATYFSGDNGIITIVDDPVLRQEYKEYVHQRYQRMVEIRQAILQPSY